MVSFSCDGCQDVVTKPRVERHMQQCRGAPVSCLDCQRTFNLSTVGAHKACISEAEKFGPAKASLDAGEPRVGGDAPARSMTQTFCGVCALALNGAVHALQHYESRKHKAALRRLEAARKQAGPTGRAEASKPARGTGDGAPSESAPANATRRRGVVKRRMESVIVEVAKNVSSSRGVPSQKLIDALATVLGEEAPPQLPQVVLDVVHKSKLLVMVDGRVRQAPPPK